MDSLLKSDIFFFISSLSVVLITTLVVILAIRVLPIIRDIRKAVSMFKEEGEQLIEDVHAVRASIKERSAVAKNTLSIIGSFFTPKKKARSKNTKKNVEKENN